VKEIDARKSLEAALEETRSAARDAERWFREEAVALRAQGLEREADFEGRLDSQRLEHEHRLAEARNECERLAQARATADDYVKRLGAELSEATRTIEDTHRESRATIDRLSAEHATARAAFADMIAERDDRLKEQAISLRASETMRIELQERLETVLAAERDEIAQVQEKLMATVAVLDATRRRREVLQTEAARPAEVHELPDESRLNTLLSFEQSTLAALHSDEEGALVRRVVPEGEATPQHTDNTRPSVGASAFAKLV